MTEVVLWAFGILFTALFCLLGVLRKMDHDRLAELSSSIKEIVKTIGTSEQAVLSEKIKYLTQDYETLHMWKNQILPPLLRDIESKIEKRLDSHAAELKNHERRITRIDKNGNGHT